MRLIAFILIIVIGLPGCTITQYIEPAEVTKGSVLCIIENPAVRQGFLNEFQSVLASKGIAHRVVERGTVPDECNWTATYTAKWSWDLALYMSYAEIKVYYNGNLDGEAKYDATRGSGNLNKFIDAEPKIRELVEQLIREKSAFLYLRRLA